MQKFYETKDKLQEAEVAMSAVTEKYNEIINGFNSQTLLMTNIIYSYRKIQTEYVMQTGKKEISDEDRSRIDAKFADYIKNNFGKDYSLENIKQLMDLASQKSQPVLDTIEKYKSELSETYLSYSPVLRHATRIQGLTKLDASRNRENQYLNEVVDAVFASSGYSDMENYIGRANVHGMQVMGNIVVYPENPFMNTGKQKPNGDIDLKDNVYLYQMDATKFEPVVDFNRSKYGKYYLEFGQEWISRNDSVECECEIIDSIPRDAFDRKQFFYKKQKIDARSLGNGKSRENMIEAYSEAIKSGKLGYINGELDIGVVEELREKGALRTNSFLQRIKDFFARRKVKMLPESTAIPKTEGDKSIESKKSWDLANWGIDVEEFRREADYISQNNLQERENGLQSEQNIVQEDRSSSEQYL